jgi:ESS family glutamate:Na+ symporter
VFRQAFKILKKHNIMHRELTNNHLLDRISGFMFDLMIIAGVAAIDLTQLSSLVVPIIIICTLGTVATFIYIRKACNILYPGYENEMFFAMFGMLTGTASNGMILLREIDPKFETPASTNLVLQNMPAIAFGGAILLVLGYCPKGMFEACVTLGIVSVALVIYTIIIFRSKIFKRKKKVNNNE